MFATSRPPYAPPAPPPTPPLPPKPLEPSPRPPLAAVDRLVLAIHEATLPGLAESKDPHGIGDRLRRASVGAADLLSRLDPEDPSGRPRTVRLAELAEARSRLAEVAYYVDLGERLGTFDPCEALELFELGLAASVDLASRLDRLIYAREERTIPPVDIANRDSLPGFSRAGEEVAAC